MSKEEIIKALKDKKKGNDCIKLLNYCKQPRGANELMKYKMPILIELREKGAIAFDKGKYTTTQIGHEALNSP